MTISSNQPEWFKKIGFFAAKVSKNLFAELPANAGISITKFDAIVDFFNNAKLSIFVTGAQTNKFLVHQCGELVLFGLLQHQNQLCNLYIRF